MGLFRRNPADHIQNACYNLQIQDFNESEKLFVKGGKGGGEREAYLGFALVLIQKFYTSLFREFHGGGREISWSESDENIEFEGEIIRPANNLHKIALALEFARKGDVAKKEIGKTKEGSIKEVINFCEKVLRASDNGERYDLWLKWWHDGYAGVNQWSEIRDNTAGLVIALRKFFILDDE